MEDNSVKTLMTRKEATAFLGGICLTTLAKLDIPRVQVRRRVFYRKDDLESWLADQVVIEGIKK